MTGCNQWTFVCATTAALLLSANLLQVVSSLVAQQQNPIELCRNVTCKAGRECRVLAAGFPECVCIQACPRKKHPICGSDGLLYESHCELHRKACLNGVHVRPQFYDRSCYEDPLAKLKREIEKAMERVREQEREHIKVPRACHQNHRDRMREYLMSWMSLTAHKQEWFTEGMTYTDIVEHHFRASDTDNDGYVDSAEWLEHLRHKNDHLKRDKATRRLRRLCVEALIEEGDRNQDWRLSLEEYSKLLDEEYQPSNKYCVRDRKHYEDGTRTKVDCNGCTCACGKWICTSRPCSPIKQHFKEDYNQYDDMDNQVD